MKETPFDPKDDLSYDPRIDFYKFLDEAKKHGQNTSFGSRMTSADHKSKRSWKKSLFFWRKHHKNKEEVAVDSQCGGGGRIKEASLECRKSFAAVSGPMMRKGGRSKDGRVVVGGGGSGPLAGWFTPRRALETDPLPYYRSLDHQDDPSIVLQPFGPIYSV